MSHFDDLDTKPQAPCVRPEFALLYTANVLRAGRVSLYIVVRDAPSSAVSVIAGPIIGMEQATRMIKERGRWHSDIYEIYERVSMQEHALASAAITEAGGIDLEQILVGWIQPGR